MKGKYLGTHTFARRYYNFASTSLFTLLDRYSKRTLGSRDPVADTVRCFESFCNKFCIQFECAPLQPREPHPLIDNFIASAGPSTLKLLGFIQQRVTTDHLNKHFFDYMKALQEKNLPSTSIQHDFDVFSMYIDFFCKKQAKPDVRHMFEERVKAGQGVSAFQKHINALLAPYSRFLAECMHDFLLEKVRFASNKSDSVVGAELAELWSTYLDQGYAQENVDKFACDFTEYDSSQYELSPYANAIFMYAMGAPLLLIDLYLTMRRDWVLSDDMMKLYGHHKMHSGEPFTLVGNTLFGMLIIAEAVEFDHLVYAAFKGDDSAIAGRNIRFHPHAQAWCRKRGLQLKDEYPPHMEFTGMLVTPYGYFPDVVRKTVKFLSTVFRDVQHYRQAVMNLDADLQCLTSCEHMLYGAKALSEFYSFQSKTNSISSEHILLLLSFLHQQTKVQYEDLPDFDRAVLSYFSESDTVEITA